MAVISLVFKFFVTFRLVAALASAKPTSGARSSMVTRSFKSDPPAGFALHGVAPADTSIPLRIALVPNDITGLEKALYDVSTPGSVNYRKHLSKEMVIFSAVLFVRDGVLT